MESVCNNCMEYKIDDDDNDEKIKNVPDFLDKYNKLIKRNLGQFKPVNYDHFKKNLYEAILFPEFAKGFKFPARKYFLLF